MYSDAAMQDRKNVCTVIKVVPENQEINSLYLQTPDEGFGVRKAGQYATIRTMRPEGWSEPHPFTISGAPEDPFIRMTIKQEGAFTRAIPNLKPGDTVKCLGPFGVFCRDIDARPAIVMIAGGVGITPFLSVLRHFRNNQAGNAVILFWANKGKDEIICLDEIRSMTRELNLTVIHALSRDENAPGYNDPAYPRVIYEKGRLNPEVFKRHGVHAGLAFYLCGPPPMMESVLSDLNQLGIPPEALEREKFSWDKR